MATMVAATTVAATTAAATKVTIILQEFCFTPVMVKEKLLSNHNKSECRRACEGISNT